MRGLAALAVLVNHVGVATLAGISAPAWLLWPADGRAAVMIFFVLSGYVIGLTYPATKESKNASQYVLRRIIRLLPVNLVGVLLACAVASQVDLRTLLANIFFLQNHAPYGGLSLPVIEGNENLWSLNYEMLYYVLFILVWRLNPSLRWVAGGALAVTVLGWYTHLLPIFLACYAAGYLFWIAGLALAWRTQPTTEESANWPSCLLLLLVTWKLRGLLNVLVGFPVPVFDGPVVMLYFLDILPVSVWLVALVARRTLPGARWIMAASVLIPVVGLAIKWHRPGYFTPLDYRMALGAYLLALLLWKWRPSLRFFRWFAPMGSIAFALYAVSRPIQIWLFGHTGWLPQNGLGYMTCALLTVTVCLAVAWGLERVMQPALKRWALGFIKPAGNRPA